MNCEQLYRLKKAQKNLEASRLLADEQHYDIAVSRAYYAMFYTAEALLLDKGLTFPQHEPVMVHFNQLFARQSQAFSPYYQYLLEGYHARLQADYKPLIPIPLTEAHRHIDRANQFLSLAQQYFAQVLAS
jgi:uncharacterized protein (UPF0332 family)